MRPFSTKEYIKKNGNKELKRIYFENICRLIEFKHAKFCPFHARVRSKNVLKDLRRLSKIQFSSILRPLWSMLTIGAQKSKKNFSGSLLRSIAKSRILSRSFL